MERSSELENEGELNIPSDRLYTKEHEWVRIEGNAAVVGITDYAQSQMGDLVFVELPKPGSALEQSKPFGVVESVKTVSDVYAPISGTVSEINGALEDEPQKINADAYGDGWLVKLTIADAAQTNSLLDASAYEAFLKTLEQ